MLEACHQKLTTSLQTVKYTNLTLSVSLRAGSAALRAGSAVISSTVKLQYQTITLSEEIETEMVVALFYTL